MMVYIYVHQDDNVMSPQLKADEVKAKKNQKNYKKQ